MDSDNETARAKWLLGAAVVFLASGCVSWNELIYLLGGRNTQANVEKVFEINRRGRFGLGGGRQLTVEYAFTEPDGTKRTGTDTVPMDWPPPVNGKIPVQYTAGEKGSSRLAGHVGWIGVTLFALSAGSVAIFGYRLMREANDATSGRKSRRGKG
ncbi:hypothetical protein [Zavarzinella formosa]|uniref:hypothetical protein n=1 Tax=Zavarzinella formosa TaxID=360055 RepID=UPI0002FFE2D0|nr:hypothetical protein [Zavarzinella formosa]